MVGGIGDLFGGVGSIVGSIINSGNQARANDIAEQNGLLQAMLGNANLNEQRRIGDRNFGIQQETAAKNYNTADVQGNRVIDLVSQLLGENSSRTKQLLGSNVDLAKNTLGKNLNLVKAMLGENTDLAKSTFNENLDLQRKTGKDLIDLTKASRFDASGDEVYYDPATGSYKVRLSDANQRLQKANERENIARSTEDQVRARAGNEANERNREAANKLLDTARSDFSYGAAPVNEGQLANQLIVADRGDREDKYKNLRGSLATNAIRTNNSSSIKDIGNQVRASPNDNSSSASDSILKALTTASNLNNQDKQNKLRNIIGLQQASTFTGDKYNPMGETPDFATTTQQADNGINNLAKAVQGNASLVGTGLLNKNTGIGNARSAEESGISNALLGMGTGIGNATSALSSGLNATNNAEAQGVGGAINSRANALMSALTGGAQAQGNALNNLASALSGAYTSEASGIGSAMSKQASLLNSQKFDLSGIGKIGSGMGGLFAAMMNNSGGDSGGLSSYGKSDRVF